MPGSTMPAVALSNCRYSVRSRVMQRRPDADEIDRFIDDLTTRLHRGELRTSLWTDCPNYLFHLTQLDNAVSILRMGRLLSRQRATELSLDLAENASPEIIEQTPAHIHQYVRMYFRPRTPTFF